MSITILERVNKSRGDCYMRMREHIAAYQKQREENMKSVEPTPAPRVEKKPKTETDTTYVVPEKVSKKSAAE